MPKINYKREVWEGWKVQDFIDELQPIADIIMSGGSWKKPFQNKKGARTINHITKMKYQRWLIILLPDMALHKGGEIMNYNSSIRSNYFKITDRDAFKKLCDKLSGEDSVEVSLNEQNMACISCYGMLTWDDNEDDDDIDIDLNKFYELLQPIIDPNDAAIFVTIGQEGMRYIGGDAVIITNNGIVYKDLWQMAFKEARTLLQSPAWTTQYEY